MDINSIKWKNRFPNRGVEPERAYSAIQKIINANGGVVSPESIVDAAKSQRSPLHKLFEWDDTEAASKFRVEQARGVCRALEITYVGRESQPVRALELMVKSSVRSGNRSESLYSTHEEVLSDPIARARLIKEATSELHAWRRRFQDLHEFAEIFRVIDGTSPMAG